MNSIRTRAARLFAGPVLTLATGALGQAAMPAAFVANNGNLEGSITSFRFGPAGEPVFVAKLVTGTTPSTSLGNLGQNPYAISLSPNGRWLATSHATASTTVERVMLFEVNADATLTTLGSFETPDSPLDCAWVNDELLAVMKTKLGQANEVIIYRFTPPAAGGPALVEVSRAGTGTFSAYVAVHPNRELIFTGDTNLNTLRAFRVDSGGVLTFLTDNFTGGYPIGAGITHDGRHIYAGGGISGGGKVIHGYSIDSNTGVLTLVPGAPFVSASPGSSPSPKLAVASSDDKFVFVGHGSSSEVRSLSRDPGTGALTDTGHAFDVGGTGDLGDAQVAGDLLLVTDSYSGVASGLYSFTIHPDGSLTMNGSQVHTQGVTPRGIAGWSPEGSCYADCDGDGALNLADFGCFQTAFATGNMYADCNGDLVLNLADFGCYQTVFAAGCP